MWPSLRFLDTKKERERTKKHTKRNPERDFAGPEQVPVVSDPFPAAG